MKDFKEIVEDSISPIGQEQIEVVIAKGRITADEVIASCDDPPYDEAIRDGYVVAHPNDGEDTFGGYRVCGEIAAGTTEIPALPPGMACRIFTGAVIPEGGTHVVPFEICTEKEGILTYDKHDEVGNAGFIRNKGSRVRKNQTLIQRGVVLESAHIELLVSLGVAKIWASRLPIVACYCTGSELVEVGTDTCKGEKSSINGWILDDLLPGFGGTIKRSGLLPDDGLAIESMLVEATDGSMDMVVTTGGMGPGKYDLVMAAFLRAGGKVILSSLPMRPGKSILLGVLNGVVVVALPGPPQAVRTLIHEFVGPLLLLMQGARRCWPEPVKAELLHDLQLRPGKWVKCRGGVISYKQGRCYVRLADGLEPETCIIVTSSEQKTVATGELVVVHLL